MAKHDRHLDQLFRALSDPTRRDIFEKLLEGPVTVGELAKPVGISLPTAMAHLKKLEDGGLVRTEKIGRTRMCHVTPEPLDAVSDWISARRAAWEARLDRLERYLDQTSGDAK